MISFQKVLWIPLVMLAYAQEPGSLDPGSNPVAIRQGLYSNSPRQVAWAAWRVGSDHTLPSGQFSQPLRDALATAIAHSDSQDDRRLTSIIIESFLRSRTFLPADEAFLLYDNFPDAALAFVVRDYGRSPELLFRLLKRAEEERNRLHWLTIASLLRSAEFMQHLAERVRFDYTIDVVDSEYLPVLVIEGVPGGVIGGIAGGVIGGGWPQWSTYCLTDTPGPGDEFLVSTLGGPIYLHASPDHSVPSASGSWSEHPGDVMRYLYSIANCAMCSYEDRHLNIPHILGGKATIIWRSSEQTRALLLQITDEYFVECRRVFNFAKYPYLTDADLRSRVTFNVRDLRRNRDVAIPDLQGLLHVTKPR